MPDIQAPQMVKSSRMLYYIWIPENPETVKSQLPSGLRMNESGAVYMNQYVVDSPDFTSGFEAPYSLTYLGADLDGHEVRRRVACRAGSRLLDALGEPARAHAGSSAQRSCTLPKSMRRWRTAEKPAFESSSQSSAAGGR